MVRINDVEELPQSARDATMAEAMRLAGTA